VHIHTPCKKTVNPSTPASALGWFDPSGTSSRPFPYTMIEGPVRTTVVSHSYLSLSIVAMFLSGNLAISTIHDEGLKCV